MKLSRVLIGLLILQTITSAALIAFMVVEKAYYGIIPIAAVLILLNLSGILSIRRRTPAWIYIYMFICLIGIALAIVHILMFQRVIQPWSDSKQASNWIGETLEPMVSSSSSAASRLEKRDGLSVMSSDNHKPGRKYTFSDPYSNMSANLRVRKTSDARSSTILLVVPIVYSLYSLLLLLGIISSCLLPLTTPGKYGNKKMSLFKRLTNKNNGWEMEEENIGFGKTYVPSMPRGSSTKSATASSLPRPYGNNDARPMAKPKDPEPQGYVAAMTTTVANWYKGMTGQQDMITPVNSAPPISISPPSQFAPNPIIPEPEPVRSSMTAACVTCKDCGIKVSVIDAADHDCNPKRKTMNKLTDSRWMDRPKYVVVRGYTPQMDDELPLTEGDIVYCEEIYPDGWALGDNQTKGKRGVFPMMCIQKQNVYSAYASTFVESPRYF